MYTLINGSPKLFSSNSEYFLNIISNDLDNFFKLDLKKDKYDVAINNIKKSDVLVLAFPLYIDSPPSNVLEFLDYLYDEKINVENKSLYIIINCGFREGEQNITGLNIIKRWCEKKKILYKGSILIGAGEIVGKKQYKYICHKALKQLYNFRTFIKEKEKCGDLITTMDFFNNKIYCFLANYNWSKKGKMNGLNKVKIKIK